MADLQTGAFSTFEFVATIFSSTAQSSDPELMDPMEKPE